MFQTITRSTKTNMRLKEDSSYNKLHGIYYTPSDMAESMIKIFLHKKYRRVLEPSCGNGIFIEKALKILGDSIELDAVEIEEKETSKKSKAKEEKEKEDDEEED